MNERLVNSFTFDELLEAYHNAEAWLKKIKEVEPDDLAWAMGMPHDEIIAKIVYDRGQIWQRLIQKAPTSHITEIENIKAQLQMASTDSQKVPIESGQRWQHRHIRGMVIEIIQSEDNNYRWKVSQFFQNQWAMTFNINSMTILKYFTRLNP